jgi:hypothetical protein
MAKFNPQRSQLVTGGAVGFGVGSPETLKYTIPIAAAGYGADKLQALLRRQSAEKAMSGLLTGTTPAPAPEPKPINDPDANVQGFLKKKTDDEILRDEYTRVIGKAPHHKLGADKMKAEIDAKINEELAPTIEIKPMFDTLLEELVTIQTLDKLKEWAKIKVDELSRTEPDNVDMFKLACNNYVTKLKSK